MIEPFNDIEAKCLECKCPNFIEWSYWGEILHSCKLEGESDAIEKFSNSPDCPNKPKIVK